MLFIVNYPHYITCSKSLKFFGRLFTIYSINGKASIAVPSTTSITINPM